MIKVLVILFSFCFYYSEAQVKDSVLLNGIMYKGYKINGLKQGIWNGYINGNLTENVTFYNGKKHGLNILYDEKGVIYSIRSYENGKQNGASISFYQNGKLKTISYHFLDEIDGLRLLYDSTGNKKSAQVWPSVGLPKYFNFNQGKMNDIASTDYLIDDSTFCCGDEYYSDGRPSFLTTIKFNNDTTFVFFKKYDTTGHPLLEGEVIYPCSKGDICDWKPTGKWIYYKENIIIRILNY